MVLSPEIEQIVTSRQEPIGGAAEESDLALAEAALTAPPAGLDQLTPAHARSRQRRILPYAISASGLVVCVALTGILWSSMRQLDTARQHLSETRAALASTQQQLSSAHADAAARKVVTDYLTLSVTDSGRVLTDYETVVACKSFGECRTAAQQTLHDLQAFQSDRAAATVPSSLANGDAMLSDGLTAGIAAMQEIITGMDNDDLGKVKDGAHKMDAAMRSIGKAESALGASSK